VIFGTAFVVAVVGCSALVSAPTPTQPIPTPTRLERERDAMRYAYDHATPADAWLARQGVRVIQAEVKSVGLDMECPNTFPVAAVSYGVYYLPSDDLYPKSGDIDSFLDLQLCFATEQDAINAGYQRGPH
jgi:hypothetical protein